MSTPGEIKTGDIKRGGFVNKMINTAADAVLDVSVASYFGDEYKSLVGIGGGGNDFSGERIAGSIGINTNASLKYTTNT